MAKGWFGEHPRRSLQERLWEVVAGPWVEGVEWDDCWLFVGAWRSRRGYGRISVGGHNGRSLQAHVAAFEHFWGRLDPEHILRHACDRKLCCSPFHTAPGSFRDNHRDRWDKDFAWACTALGAPPRWWATETAG